MNKCILVCTLWTSNHCQDVYFIGCTWFRGVQAMQKTAHPWLGWASFGFYDWKCYLRLRGMPLRVST